MRQLPFPARAYLLAAASLLSVGCKRDPEANADVAATDAAKRYVEDTHRSEVLGLRGADIFGRITLNTLLSFGSDNRPPVQREAGGVRLVTFSFWCSGATPAGDYGQYDVTVGVKMAREANGTFRAESSKILSRQDLGFVKQFFTWWLFSTIAPIVLWIYLVTYCAMNVYVVNWIVRIGSTPIAAGLAYDCFGSWVAVAVFVAMHIGLIFLYGALISSIVGSLSRPRHHYY